MWFDAQLDKKKSWTVSNGRPYQRIFLLRFRDWLRTFNNTIKLLVKINLTGEVHIKSSSDEV